MDEQRFQVDVMQDQTSRRYAFTVYGLGEDDTKTLLKRSMTRYFTPMGALRRGSRWVERRAVKARRADQRA